MRFKTFSLGFALLLGFLASIAGPQPQAEAALCSANFCDVRKAACLTGCPCAEFTCNPVTCQSSCVCPIWCPPES